MVLQKKKFHRTHKNVYIGQNWSDDNLCFLKTKALVSLFSYMWFNQISLQPTDQQKVYRLGGLFRVG